MTQDPQTYRRAANAALAGLVIQLALAIIAAIVGLAVRSPAIHAATWHLLGGLPIWIILLLLFHQHRLEREEALEAEQLALSDAKAAAIFDERGDQVQVARSRLANLYKWGLGLISLILAAYLIILGPVLLSVNIAALSVENLRESAFFTQALGSRVNTLVLMAVWAGVGLGAFLVARYIAGMTRIKEWQLLRGGASYLMGNTLVAALLLLGATAAHFEVANLMAYLRLVIPGLMTLIGAEILLTFLLSAYRPRLVDEVPRPAFDSRVLGMLTTPESIAKAVGDAINYQFGFEVSRSWFYRLLGKAIAPLVIFGLVMLWLASSVVIVEAPEQAIVTRFGQIVTDPPLDPGPHLKLPWPISSAQTYKVQRVQQLTIGSLSDERLSGPILWTNEHAAGEESYLVTAPSTRFSGGRRAELRQSKRGAIAGGDKAPPSMSLVGAEIIVHYKISDLLKYVQSAGDPNDHSRLQVIAERAVNAYFVTMDIDSLLARSRVARSGIDEPNEPIGEDLRSKIAADISDTQIEGVEILRVCLAGVHPPQKSAVALSFHKRISALQEKQSAIERAKRQRIETLATVAGTEDDAIRIYGAIIAYNDAKANHGVDSSEAKGKLIGINRMLVKARGTVAKKIYGARAHRWREALAARGRAERFQADLLAYRAAPEYYRVKRFMRVLAEGMKEARKVLVSTSGPHAPIIRLNLLEGPSGLGRLTPEP